MSLSVQVEKRGRGERWRIAAQLLVLNLLLLAAAPIIACWLAWRWLFRGKPLGSWRHRLGLVPRLEKARPPRIWAHAVSAGEVSAVRPVLEALRVTIPDARIALSTITDTGMAMARKSCREADVHFYLPFDGLASMGMAFSRLRPQLLVLSEKELWPNFLGLARLRGVGVLLVNCRVSDRTMRRSRWMPGFVRWLYRLPDRLCVQSERDAQRLVELGVPARRIVIAGNTKVDAMTQRDRRAEADLATDLGVTAVDSWLVAGSTHPGEEEAIMDAFCIIRDQLPGARLLLAPRHTERLPAVSALVAQRDFPVVRRTERAPSSGAVVILDTMGELRAAYGLAAAGFVGGTLAPIGGHNLLEPPAAGRAVLFGPHTESCADIADLVLNSKVGFRVADPQELAERFLEIANDGALRSEIAKAAAVLIEQQRGASYRCAQAARELLAARGVR